MSSLIVAATFDVASSIIRSKVLYHSGACQYDYGCCKNDCDVMVSQSTADTAVAQAFFGWNSTKVCLTTRCVAEVDQGVLYVVPIFKQLTEARHGQDLQHAWSKAG